MAVQWEAKADCVGCEEKIAEFEEDDEKLLGESLAATPAAATLKFAINDEVLAQYTDGEWYPAKISIVHPPDAKYEYTVDWDDEDPSHRWLPARCVRPRS